ncbi:hypothetical protein Syun_005861 [Stephania yunnanensis]|uniref:R13L1/DRL21-like LRR repeat region domain-containing protein n=1 Tax=Stephania yunnanensis TaxID=152371 RepID=A0AAP0PY26_9MAGN
MNLKKLRHLFIDDGEKWEKMPQAMGELVELQTLSIFVVCQENGISVLENLNNLRGALEIRRLGLAREASLAKRANVLSKKSKLRKLELYWDRDSSVGDEGGDLQVLEELQPHQNLHELCIKGFGGVQFPRWMSSGSLLPNLKSMKISNCSNCEHIPSFGELACLERLGIMNMSKVKSIGGSKDEQMGTTTTPQSYSCSCLKVLKLSIKNCPNLRMTPHSFPSLKSLKLEDVGGMGVVSITSSLTSLTSLSITRCEDLEFLPEGLLTNNDQLIIFNVEKCPKLQAFKEEGLMVSNSNSLRELKIGDCDALKSIPDVRDLTSLQKLEVQSCGELEMIPKGFWSSFVALESLHIYRCKKLKGTIELSPSMKHLRKVQIEKCPNLEGFDICSGILTALEELVLGPFLEDLNCFPPLISEDDGDDAVDFNNLLPSLRELQIKGWPALQFLPHHLQYLTTLKSLIIEHFTNLTELPEWIGNLASLERLEICQCENLTHLPSKEQIQRLTFLRTLEISFCPNLQSIKQPVLPWCHTSLQQLCIWKCDGVASIDLGSFVSLRILNVFCCSGLQALQGLPILRALEKLMLGPFSKDSDCFPSLLGGDYDDDNGDEVASNTPLPSQVSDLWVACSPSPASPPSTPHHAQIPRNKELYEFDGIAGVDRKPCIP